jgi:hypothetical protein
MSDRRRDERGAFIVIWAVLITALMIMVAIVIDLGQMRSARRSVQSAADISLLAGGGSFSTPVGLDPMSACQDTIRYLNQDLPSLPASLDPIGFCNQSGKELNKTICNPPFTSPVAAPSTTTGPYRIEVRYPVYDSDIVDASGPRSTDGDKCERMQLNITRTDSSVFAGIIGVHQLTSKASATIRRMPVNASLFPALWLLDPRDCTALDVGGTTTRVNVGTTATPGIVTIDSDGTDCTGQQATLDANGGAQLKAIPLTGTGYDRGMISLYAHPASSLTCNRSVYHDCDEADIPSNIQPQPIRRDTRATRAPVDWRYNCKRNYPSYTTIGQDKKQYKVAIKDCPNYATVPAYMDQLRSAIGNAGAISGYTDYNGPCTLNGAPVMMPAGNLRITCPTFKVQTVVTFPGQNVVFDGDIQVTGKLVFNQANPLASLTGCVGTIATCSSQQAALMYMRKGNLVVNGGGSFDLRNTALYEDGGYLNFGGGGTPAWSAPLEGPFRSLAYWDEYESGSYSVNGGASMSLSGIFFTPFADPFSISGGSPTAQQDAQFVSRKVSISGGGTLNLAPKESDAISLPPPAAILIR